MLNKHLKYLFSVLSAIYFILAGTGYNVVQFCCDDCEEEGIEFVAQNSCAAVHHEQNHDCFDFNDAQPFEALHQSHVQSCSHDNSCQVIRVQLDDFSVADEIINTNNVSNNLFFKSNVENFISGQLIYSHVLHEYSPPPQLFVLCGREILSNKSVLVI